MMQQNRHYARLVSRIHSQSEQHSQRHIHSEHPSIQSWSIGVGVVACNQRLLCRRAVGLRLPWTRMGLSCGTRKNYALLNIFLRLVFHL